MRFGAFIFGVFICPSSFLGGVAEGLEKALKLAFVNAWQLSKIPSNM